MELKEILAISGQPGLYKYVAQSSRGVIVESLSDGKRMNAASNSKVSALTEISIFTEGEDIPLAEVSPKFTNIRRDSRPSATRRLRKTQSIFRRSIARIRPRPSPRIGHEEGFLLVQYPRGCRVHRIQTARRAGSIKIRRCSLSTGVHRCRTFARIDNTAPIPHLPDGAFL